MKRMMVSIFACLLLIGLSACGNSTSNNASKKSLNQLEEAKQNGVLTIGSDGQGAPFTYIDNGVWKGMDIEIFNKIAADLGIKKVEWKQIDFDKLFVELNKGSINIAAEGIYVNPDRKKVINFSNVWFKEGESLVVSNDSSIKSLSDLKNKSVAVQKGGIFVATANQWAQEGKIGKVVVFTSTNDMLLAVNTGKVDATLLDGFIGSYTLHQSANLSLKLAPDYQSKDVGMIAVAGPKSSDTSLLDAINQEMKKLKDNGFIAQVFDKYGIDKTFMVPTGEDQMTNIK